MSIITKADGIHIYDTSNNKYIDTRFGAGTFILGYVKQFNEQIYKQIQKGTLFGHTSENEIIFKKTLKTHLNWFEDFIFCNSGSESIMRAFRIAKSFTGKSKIAIFSSFWHGGYDGTQIKNEYQYKTVISSSGIHHNQIDHLILLPNDDLKKTKEILNRHRKDIAMIFCEPVQQIIPHNNYGLLMFLRNYTTQYNILLGFDEMITGFRLAIGGAQEVFNIKADLACYGKIIGGGYPIGVLGINKDLKTHIDTAIPPIRLGGTFSGNPLTMYAGNLIVNYLSLNKYIYTDINNMTTKLCTEINTFCKYKKYPIRLRFFGSFYRIIYTDTDIYSMEERLKYELDKEKQKTFTNILKINGILLASNPLAFISYYHTDNDINNMIEIYKKSIDVFLTIQ